MNLEKQKELGLGFLKATIESVDRNKADGRLEIAKGDFYKATGMLMMLEALGIVNAEEAAALRKDIYESHSVYP